MSKLDRQIKQMFSDARCIKPESFIAGCLLFGLMIVALLIQYLVGHTIGEE